jgi:hypothetical protein
MKDMSAREIYADINNTLRADCVGCATVTKSLKGKSFSKSMLGTDFRPKIEEENFIDETILGALEECPFSSFRQIVKRILIPMSTVRYHLVNSLGYRIRNIRWVPHTLSSSQKQARVEMSQSPFHALRSTKHHARKYIVALDKARFYFSNHFDRIWLPHDELPPHSETDDYKSEINDYSRMKSPRTPRDTIHAQRNQVGRQILFR